MNDIKCFDVVTMVTDEATQQFGSLVCEDNDKKDSLESCCSIIDNLAERFGGEAFEVEVDKDTEDIIISLTCAEFIIESEDEFYELLEHVKSFSIKASEDGEDLICIDFVFDGIWMRAS